MGCYHLPPRKSCTSNLSNTRSFNPSGCIPRGAPSPAPKGLSDGPRVRRLQTLRSRPGTAPVTLMRNRLRRAGKEGGLARRARAPQRSRRLPSLPPFLPSSLWPALGTPQPPGTPVTCGAAPAPSPGPRRWRGGERRPDRRGEKNVPRQSGEAAWFDFPPLWLVSSGYTSLPASSRK